MSKIRVAINGFGRIGRVFTRALQDQNEIELVAINDLSNPETLAMLLKYDSVHGRFPKEVSFTNNSLVIDGIDIPIYAQKDPASLPWGDLNVDVVLEATGVFRTEEKASLHLQAGAKKVVLSAPPKGGNIGAYVMGINEYEIKPDERIISNASCTTNSIAHVVKAIDEAYGIESGFLTTIHAYTSDQRLHDAPHSDLRRARAAAQSIIPTSTGAANAVIKLFPHLEGKFKGGAMRVPTADGSLSDMTFNLKNPPASVDEANALFEGKCKGDLKGLLQYSTDPIVSIDIVGNPHSGIFDAPLTSLSGDLLKVVSWYDNEYGYSSRCVGLISHWMS